MRNVRHAILAAAVIGCSLPAAGQSTPTFLVEQGHWWVSRLGHEGCIAQNRPLLEFNAVPYNAVVLQQQVGEERPRLQAVFWPNSFEAGKELQLLVVPSSGQPFQYPATAASDYHASGVAPLTEAELDKLSASATVTVGGDATPGSLVVETRELDEVVYWLAQCASQTGQQPPP